MSGVFSVEFELELENDEKVYKSDSVVFKVSGFNIDSFKQLPSGWYDTCIHCDESTEYYFNSGEGVCENHRVNYDFCSGCNTLFEKGTLNGAKCSSCD